MHTVPPYVRVRAGRACVRACVRVCGRAGGRAGGRGHACTCTATVLTCDVVGASTPLDARDSGFCQVVCSSVHKRGPLSRGGGRYAYGAHSHAGMANGPPRGQRKRNKRPGHHAQVEGAQREHRPPSASRHAHVHELQPVVFAELELESGRSGWKKGAAREGV